MHSILLLTLVSVATKFNNSRRRSGGSKLVYKYTYSYINLVNCLIAINKVSLTGFHATLSRHRISLDYDIPSVRRQICHTATAKDLLCVDSFTFVVQFQG